MTFLQEIAITYSAPPIKRRKEVETVKLNPETKVKLLFAHCDYATSKISPMDGSN